jgi:hypothetical protein
MKLIFYSVAIIFALLLVFQYGNVYATHLTEKTTWQLIYVTHNSVCSNYDYQVLDKYAVITEKYFELYKFANTKYDPLCMTNDSYKNSYKTPIEVDLVVVVYDRELGESELHTKKFGGAYLHDGSNKQENHAIIMCDCATFYYSDPVWILSHELSHFILNILNYDTNIIEKLVHVNDKKYDSCMKDYNPHCASVIHKLRVDSMAYSFSVMAPYKNAIGVKKLEMPSQAVPASVISLNKVITKWWTEGKITEADYASAIGHMVGQQKIPGMPDDKIVYADGPISGNVTTWEDILKPQTENDDIFSLVPSASESELNKINDESQVLPDWFEYNAKSWAEGKITTEDFIRNVKYLKQQQSASPQLENMPNPILSKTKSGNSTNLSISLYEN